MYDRYSVLRSECKVLIKVSHNMYIQNLQDNLQSNVKLFWAYAKNRKQSNSYPTQFEYNGSVANKSEDICNLFASFFKSSYTNQSLNQSSVELPILSPVVSPIIIHQQQITQILVKLDVNKNGGPDGIPNIFLKHTAKYISRPLTIIFNKSLQEGDFPHQLKEAHITPIFKKGKNQVIENYRPVSLLNSIALVFEKIVLCLLQPTLDDRLSHQQHGFTKGKSTSTNLNEFIHYISNAMDDGLEVHAIFTDFSKAFDTVDHALLLNKMRYIGVDHRLIQWFQSYLSNRLVSVIFNGSKSVKFMIPCGVPQGSVLGPILFNIFINDLSSRFKSEYLFYADDLKLFCKVTSPLVIHQMTVYGCSVILVPCTIGPLSIKFR